MSARSQSRFDGIRCRVRRAIMIALQEVLGPPPAQAILDLTYSLDVTSVDRHKEEPEPCQDEDGTKQ